MELGVSKCNLVSFVVSANFSSSKNILSCFSFVKATQPVFMNFPFCSDLAQVCTGQSYCSFLIISELEVG